MQAEGRKRGTNASGTLRKNQAHGAGCRDKQHGRVGGGGGKIPIGQRTTLGEGGGGERVLQKREAI